MIPDQFNYPGNLPTYYDKQLFIQDATPLPFIRFNEAYPRINALPATVPEDSLGGGVITAFVTESTDGRSSGIPVEGLAIWLTDANKKPIQLAKTDAFGYIEFTNLPIGSYYFLCDKYGINNEQAPQTILAATAMKKELNFLLHPNFLALQMTTSTAEINFDTKIKFYPNPGQGLVNFQLPSNFRPTNYQILDPIGKVINIGKLNKNQQQLDLTFLSKGLYTIEFFNQQQQRIIGKWVAF